LKNFLLENVILFTIQGRKGIYAFDRNLALKSSIDPSHETELYIR